MANIPSVRIVHGKTPGVFFVVAVCAERIEGYNGCWWTVTNHQGNTVVHSYSKGRQGCGSALTAMAAGVKAANYRLKKIGEK